MEVFAWFSTHPLVEHRCSRLCSSCVESMRWHGWSPGLFGNLACVLLLTFWLSSPFLVWLNSVASAEVTAGLAWGCICRWKCVVLRFALELMSCHFAVTLCSSQTCKPLCLTCKKGWVWLNWGVKIKKKELALCSILSCPVSQIAEFPAQFRYWLTLRRMTWVICSNWRSWGTFCFPSYFTNENLTGEGHSVNVSCHTGLVEIDGDGISVLFRALGRRNCNDLGLSVDQEEGRDLIAKDAQFHQMPTEMIDKKMQLIIPISMRRGTPSKHHFEGNYTKLSRWKFSKMCWTEKTALLPWFSWEYLMNDIRENWGVLK